ncbi:MAG: LysR family transcriptional regulator substrate-binding protein [Acidihalobacter sp.]
MAGLVIEPWRRDPILAFLKAAQENPAEATPQWMASQALILNGAGTHLSQLIGNWFADAGLRPEPRISLDYNDAIKNLVGAGYGSTLLPHEEGALLSDQRVVTRPLDPPLWRELGMAYRQGEHEPATAYLLQALFSLQQQ